MADEEETTTQAEEVAPPTEEDNEPKETSLEPVKADYEKPPVDLPTILIFDRYDPSQVIIPDVGLARYMNLNPYAGVPHNGGRHANTHFAKMRIPLVERLINHMMRTEDYTGKKLSAYKVVRDAFAIIEQRAKENPIQVFVNAICQVAPKEETTRLRYGGISVPKAVDTSPQRRLDLSIRFIAKGAVQSSHKNRKAAPVCLAEEILKASKGDMSSFAIAKKDESERVAKSAR